MIDKQKLIKLYLKKKKSMAEVANILDVSYHKVVYAMKKYKIKRRSRSEATYVKLNPNGDPFAEQKLETKEEYFLKGLGLGFYWGEGTKREKYSIRIANSDPEFIRIFIKFLKRIYKIDESKLRFAIHIFDDLDPQEVLDYWKKQLEASEHQFYKTQIVKIRKEGTYNNKSKYGVLTVHFNNKKLRDIIMDEIEKVKRFRS